ncbi:MAG: hypothetical protein IKL10_10500 [Clostridia bacterium]|nr:hypothetical protein [Clostridia bacterium]
MDNYFINHMEDLSSKAMNNGIFTFSNFLNEEEINELFIHKKDLTKFTLFGGAEGTARKMVRFGDEEELYYSEDFPIETVKIEPVNKKFAETLSHRDYLGAIMNLSIERELIGDIVIRENEAFVFVTRKLSSFICENLTRIKHTDVKCTLTEFEEGENLFTLEDNTVISSSLRADCVICAVYNLSRSAAESLFKSKKVFINSAQCENTSKQLKENDTISVRGYGKFIYCGEISSTKKGRLKIGIKIYK